MPNSLQNTAPTAFNSTDLLKRVENDQELLQELLTIFKQDYPLQLRSLKVAILRAEMKQVQASSHTLKGMFSNLAMARAAEAAANLEQMGRNEERTGLKEALVFLEQEVADLMPVVDSYLQGVPR